MTALFIFMIIAISSCNNRVSAGTATYGSNLVKVSPFSDSQNAYYLPKKVSCSHSAPEKHGNAVAAERRGKAHRPFDKTI